MSANPGHFLIFFRPMIITMSITTILFEKSVDGGLGSRTLGRMIESADESTIEKVLLLSPPTSALRYENSNWKWLNLERPNWISKKWV